MILKILNVEIQYDENRSTHRNRDKQHKRPLNFEKTSPVVRIFLFSEDG